MLTLPGRGAESDLKEYGCYCKAKHKKNYLYKCTNILLLGSTPNYKHCTLARKSVSYNRHWEGGQNSGSELYLSWHGK